MPRTSPEAISASLYRTGGKPPPIPNNLGRNGRDLWNAIIASRPLDHWTPSACALLARMIRTLAAADRASAQLARQRDLSDAKAIVISRQVVALNASASMLMVRLRLTPQTSHSRREEGFNNERGTERDPEGLIGGYARAGNGAARPQ